MPVCLLFLKTVGRGERGAKPLQGFAFFAAFCSKHRGFEQKHAKRRSDIELDFPETSHIVFA